MNWWLGRKPARFAFGIAISLCVVLLLIPATVTAAQTKVYPQPSTSVQGQISGRVSRSDTGEPIPKAQVQLSPADPETSKSAGPERIVRTGPDGTFVFPDLPAGTYGVTVWRNGFSEFSPHGDRDSQGRYITLKPGQKLENLDLHLNPTGVIAGKVSDEDQEPIQGLEVFALRINFQPGGRKQVSASGRTVTDDLGGFRLSNLAPGSYYVSAGGLIHQSMREVGLKQGPAGGMHYRNTLYPGTPSLDEAQVLRVGPDLATNDIRLTVPTERTYAITGKVLTGVGHPALKDAEVSCERADAAGYTFEAAVSTVRLAEDLSFKFSSLYAGEYTLSVTPKALEELPSEEIRRLLTFALVGAGTVGVEMAGTLAEMSPMALAHDFRHIDPRTARILLYEAAPRILPTYPEVLSLKAQRHLESLGVEVFTNARVTSVDSDGIVVGGHRVPAGTVLWGAGVVASLAAHWLGAETDKSGKVMVAPDLSVRAHPEVFVIGDTAHLVAPVRNLFGIKSRTPMLMPGVAQPAIQEGKYVADVIRRRVTGRAKPKPFWYWDKGDLAIVGRTYAVADLRFSRFAGFAGWLLWAGVHIYFLIGFANRLFVLPQWGLDFLTKRRRVRVLSEEPPSTQNLIDPAA